MIAKKSNFKLVVGLMTGLLLLFAAGGLYYRGKSEDLARKKNLVEQHANSALLAKAKDITTLNNKLEKIIKDNESLSNQVKGADSVITQHERKINQLEVTNSKRLLLLRDSMESQRTTFNDLTKGLMKDNLTLVDQNKQLNNQISQLEEQLQTMVPGSALTADGFRVEAVKRNDKVTAKAKKVHVLTVSFNVPNELKMEGNEELYLSLTDLQGNLNLAPLRSETVAINDKIKTIPVHAVETVDGIKTGQRITFMLESTQDIKPGIYRAAVYTNHAYLGAVEFEFRDSFWFF